jgi:hypothetical protein
VSGTCGTACVVIAIAVVLLAPGGSDRGHDAAPDATPAAAADRSATSVAVTIVPSARQVAIPRSFFGLSTEYWTLPADERHVALYLRMLSLLHVPGDGRFILRIGGDSASHTFYDPNLRQPPRWTFELTPAFIVRTARIVKALRLRVILDLNLVTGSPRLAGAWAYIAEKTMPRGSIIGFEIANEPDLYDRAFWLFTTAGEQFSGRALPRDITPESYAQDYNAYARVLARLVPHVPLLAPALANPLASRKWIALLLAGPHPGLGEVSGHRYPYSACALRGWRLYPTIGRILSEQATAGTARALRTVVKLAAHADLPFRLTEINSITCGGLAGVSNSFATALWAPDAVFEYVRTGIRGVNLHARVGAINDPFTFDARGGLVVHPLLYGLILFARTLGPNARLLNTQWHASVPHLKAWAVAVGKSTLHVLLLNKGPSTAGVAMTLPASRRASLQRLLAASPAALSGETLAGQSLNRDGRWVGRRVSELVTPRGHRYSVALPPYSAALVSVRVSHLH